jgi:hypothetical protein
MFKGRETPKIKNSHNHGLTWEIITIRRRKKITIKMLLICLLEVDIGIFRHVWPQLIGLHDLTMAMIAQLNKLCFFQAVYLKFVTLQIINTFLGYTLLSYTIILIILDYFNIVIIIFTAGISVPD